MAGIKRALQRWARPPVKPGHRRVEWICTCGDLMYRDYDDSDPEALDAFIKDRFGLNDISGVKLFRLREHSGGRPDQSQSNNATSNGGAKPADGAGGTGGTTGGSTRSTGGGTGGPVEGLGAGSNAGGALGVGNPVSPGAGPGSGNPGDPGSGQGPPDPNPSAQPQPDSNHPSPNRKKYLELCVNVGNHSIHLGEIDISDARSDCDMFEKLKTEYHKLRPFNIKRIFLKPAGVHFVQFELFQRCRVGIRGGPPPQLPPAGQPYEYVCVLPPPMSNKEFLHQLYKNPQEHSVRDYIHRLPKKLNERILDSALNRGASKGEVYGWGMHVIEGPNKVLLSWICFGIILLSFFVSMAYALTMKTQEQGFGIGQWIVASLGTALAALYFQFEELES